MRLRQTALLISVACVLQIVESMVPHPVPGLRLGLANLPSLIALINLGFGPALEINLLRTVLSSLIMGSFMSPGFILSLCAAGASTLVMGGLYWLSGFHDRYRFSITGVSIAGALTHNLVQLFLAYLLLIRHKGIFVFLPWLSLGAIATGWVTAMLAASVYRKIQEVSLKEGGQETVAGAVTAPNIRQHYLPGNSFLHRLPAVTKVLGLFAVSLMILVFDSLWFYLALCAFFAAAVLVFPSSFKSIFLKVRGYGFLILTAFLLPVFFNSGTHVVADLSLLRITSEGLHAGLLFSLRNLFLISVSCLVVVTTPLEELTRALARLLSFLKITGISGERISRIFSLAWVSIGVFWDSAQKAIARTPLKGTRDLRGLVSLLSGIIALLYLQAQAESALESGARTVTPGAEKNISEVPG
ncbi:MAG: Gx transporter family protein [Endomicrobiales bacterium]